MAEVDEEGQLIDEEQETQDTRFKQMRSIHGSSNSAEYLEKFHDLLRIVDYQHVSLVHLLSEDINEGKVIIFFGMVAVFDAHLEGRSKEFAAAASQLEEMIPGNQALEKVRLGPMLVNERVSANLIIFPKNSGEPGNLDAHNR